MTHRALSRKVVILSAALGLVAGLTACDSPTIGETFARLKEVDVDSGQVREPTDPKSIQQKDIDLVIETAKDMTLGEGGLMEKSKAQGPKLEIAVVDPLDMTSDSETPVDEITRRVVQAAARELPDVPVVAMRTMVASQPAVQPQKPAPAQVRTPTQAGTSGKLIQVGSYSTTAAAQSAWRDLQTRHPAVARYTPSYQKITTASGKAMVRLKIGPVAADKAQALCGQLGVTDAWCVRAS